MIEHIFLKDEPNGEAEFHEALQDAQAKWGHERVLWFYDETLHGYCLRYPIQVR